MHVCTRARFHGLMGGGLSFVVRLDFLDEDNEIEILTAYNSFWWHLALSKKRDSVSCVCCASSSQSSRCQRESSERESLSVCDDGVVVMPSSGVSSKGTCEPNLMSSTAFHFEPPPVSTQVETITQPSLLRTLEPEFVFGRHTPPTADLDPRLLSPSSLIDYVRSRSQPAELEPSAAATDPAELPKDVNSPQAMNLQNQDLDEKDGRLRVHDEQLERKVILFSNEDKELLRRLPNKECKYYYCFDLMTARSKFCPS